MVIRAFFAFAGNDVERFLILNKSVGKISQIVGKFFVFAAILMKKLANFLNCRNSQEIII